MAKVGDKESITHNRIVELFQQQLGYRYLGNRKDRDNSNIELDLLHSFMLDQQGYSQTQIVKATYELQKVAIVTLTSDQIPTDFRAFNH